MIGALQYYFVIRPNIIFIVSKLCQFLISHIDVHLKVAKRVMHYFKRTMIKPTELDVHGYIDADWASYHDDRRSTYCIFFGENLIN